VTAWERLLRPAVADVGAYRPGVSGAEIKARYGLAEVVRLNWNENLSGALPGVLEQTAAELGESWAYPEESFDAFRRAVAGWSGAAPEQVLPGHGIQALTLALVAAFIAPGDRVVIPRPTYGLYSQACGVAGAVIERVDSGPSLALDLERIAAVARDVAAKLVWICDPNNPTGLRLEPASWRRFLDALPTGCVAVVDEAYCDYIEPEQRIDRLAELRQGRPIVILRTFSKIFGLAGLRLGYALVDEPLAAFLHAVQEPFNVNRAALAAGLASLQRTALLPARREQVARARAHLTEPLERAGIRCLRSDANFVLVELGCDDVAVGEELAREGLLIRPGSEFGLPGFARVTTGSEELMDAVARRLIEAVRAPARSATPARGGSRPAR
jgi:histidinol-phosphate aminotransferase